MNMVPDFFQDESEEAMRAQVTWQLEHLGLGDVYFAKLLGEDRRRFSSWQLDLDTLAPEWLESFRFGDPYAPSR